MDVIAPVTDYIPESILTTQGDLVIMGAAEAQRLGIGSGGYIPRVNAGATALAYEKAGNFITEDRSQGQNAGAVTLTSGGVSIVDLSLGTCYYDDFLLIAAQLNITKDANAGWVRAYVYKTAGTGEITFYTTMTQIGAQHYLAASEMVMFNLSAIGRITMSGTLTLSLYGLTGSNQATASAGNNGLQVVHLTKYA